MTYDVYTSHMIISKNGTCMVLLNGISSLLNKFYNGFVLKFWYAPLCQVFTYWVSKVDELKFEDLMILSVASN